MVAVKSLILLLLVVLGLLGLAFILYKGGRWIYNEFISDNAADKRELRALIDEYDEKVKGN